MRLTEALPHLPAGIARHTLDTLIALLPAPAIDTREARIARDEAAITAVAALQPADAFEALLATQIVGARAHAMECLRLAAMPGQPLKNADHSRALAASLFRLAKSGLHALQRQQARRRKAAQSEAHPASTFVANGLSAAYRLGDAAAPSQAKRRTPRRTLH